MTIKLSICYPSGSETRFDRDYFLATHIPMVKETMQAHGLRQVELTEGVQGLRGETPPYQMVTNLYFDSPDDMQAALKAAGPALMQDMPNYTDTKPVNLVTRLVA